MQLRALSEATGTPVATIKFYLREGLLPPGRILTQTRADYGDAHVRRLGTIRALRRAVGLSVAQIRGIVRLIDSGAERIEVMKAIQVQIQGLPAPQPGRTTAGDDVVRLRGWPPLPTGARAALDDHLEAMEKLGILPDAAVLDAYSAAADAIAQVDIGNATEAPDLETLVTRAAVAMHMRAQLVVKLLALAQTSRSIMRHGPAAPGPGLLAQPDPGAPA
ncbi:MerR family transcriptional regulator [Sinomonas mesophila]|uniref:MerR family transcriptional regulator n=1 Tax=Sinomonas mesophila TaxID=1531955 RepID=UPI00098637BC|nr:MerR family transcriptional regulator [Sinomonas mesophila]